MNLPRVEALLSKLERHRTALYSINFGDEIADFDGVELQALSAHMNRAIHYRHCVDVWYETPETL